MVFDAIDDNILKELSKEDTPSISDLAEKVGLSKTAIFNRLQKLQYWNMITQPAKGQHRARKLTEAGTEYLTKNYGEGAIG